MNQSINTDNKNSKEPQQKYRLGTVSIKILGGLNRFYGRPTSPSAKYILHDLSIELRDNLYFLFSIPTPGFPHFYYMLGANLGLPLYGEVSVLQEKTKQNSIGPRL